MCHLLSNIVVLVFLCFCLMCRRKPTWACTPEECQKADWSGKRQEGWWWAVCSCPEAAVSSSLQEKKEKGYTETWATSGAIGSLQYYNQSHVAQLAIHQLWLWNVLIDPLSCCKFSNPSHDAVPDITSALKKKNAFQYLCVIAWYFCLRIFFNSWYRRCVLNKDILDAPTMLCFTQMCVPVGSVLTKCLLSSNVPFLLSKGCWDNATEAEKGGWNRERKHKVQVKNEAPRWIQLSVSRTSHVQHSSWYLRERICHFCLDSRI